MQIFVTPHAHRLFVRISCATYWSSPGRRVVDAISLSIPITSLDGKDPRESTEMVDAVAEVLKKLAAEVG